MKTMYTFARLKCRICSYISIADFEAGKEHLRQLVAAHIHDETERQQLLKFIEWKELQLASLPVFDEEGYLLNSRFSPVHLTWLKAKGTTLTLVASGYDAELVRIDGGHYTIRRSLMQCDDLIIR